MPEQPRLAKVIPSEQSNDMPAVAYYPPFSQQEFELEPPAVPLSHYLWVLRRQLWKILAFIASCVLVTAVVSARLQPIYESTTTVDIDRQAPSEVVGQNSASSTAPDDADQFLATQIKLLQSDAVLRPVAEQFHLLNSEGQLKGKSTEKAKETARAPVVLKNLKVTRPPNTYLLLISYRATDPVLAADVANATATSYLNHTYDIHIRSSASLSSFMEKQLEALKAKMESSNLALAKFQNDYDVVNPEEKTNILSARLLQLNTDYTAAQGERISKEAAWNAMKSGSLEAAQVSSQGTDLAQLNQTLNHARQRFALVKATYGPTHPEYRKAASELAEVEKQIESTRSNVSARIAVQYHESLNREQMLKKAVANTKADWDQINSKSFEYQQLKQEADANKALYDELIKKIQESDINSGFQNNNIRIADFARPAQHRVFPNTKLNLFLVFLSSTLLAIGAALLYDSLDTTLRDPKEASRFLGTEVIGTMPVDRLTAQLPKGGGPVSTAVIVPQESHKGNRKDHYRSTSDFEEAVRTIRNTILLSDFEGRLRSIVLTSAAPGEGKTTIAAHLAIANADRGKKTLLVDGDLRRPSIHAKFGVTPDAGLSNVLTGDRGWQDVILPVTGRPNLTILPAGPSSHRAADLIGPRLASLLDEFAKEYDLVILDSPPLLGFAECLQMATAADGVLIISQAGKTKRKAVAEVVSVLNRLRANILGVVLNQVSPNTSADAYFHTEYYGYKHYQESE